LAGLTSPETLERLARLLDAGRSRSRPETYELDRAGEALQALATTHTQGELAIRIARSQQTAPVSPTGAKPEHGRLRITTLVLMPHEALVSPK
jgi:hypothetical protein